jgi:hypothetical protein
LASSCLFFDQFQKCFGITGCIRNGSFGLFNSNYLNRFWQRNLPGQPAAPAKTTAEAASLPFFVENRRDKRPALRFKQPVGTDDVRKAPVPPRLQSAWRLLHAALEGDWLGQAEVSDRTRPFFLKNCCLAVAPAQGGLISSAKPATSPCKTGGSMPRKGQVPRAEPQQFMQKQPHSAHGGSREAEKQCWPGPHARPAFRPARKA